MPALRTRCRHHADRAGIGVCTRCHATLCEECATRVEGILHCKDCLRAYATSDAVRGWRSLSALGPALALTPVVWAALGLSLYALAALVALFVEWVRGPAT
jgi:hypothetical protein